MSVKIISVAKQLPKYSRTTEEIIPFLKSCKNEVFIIVNDSTIIDFKRINNTFVKLKWFSKDSLKFHNIFHTELALYTVDNDEFSTLTLDIKERDSLLKQIK